MLSTSTQVSLHPQVLPAQIGCSARSIGFPGELGGGGGRESEDRGIGRGGEQRGRGAEEQRKYHVSPLPLCSSAPLLSSSPDPPIPRSPSPDYRLLTPSLLTPR